MVGIVGAMLIVVALVGLMKHYTTPELSKAGPRAAERAKAGAEVRAAGAEALSTYGWENQQRGVVRLTLPRAIELTLREYKNPAAARSNFAARAERANPTPATTFE